MTCASCGFAAPPDFAFCPRCGTRLEAPAAVPAVRDADRRTATVLFADLSGFTTLSERLDPEDVRALQSDLIQELSAAIQKYDGFIEKYVGDAVLAVFGAPVAHEDDAERALRAALAMKQRVAVLSERWQRWLGAPLELHIGVNTGAVVAGQVGTGSSAAYAVTGDTVNTAARLQGEAGPGEILVSEPTFRLTEQAFTFGAADSVRLKGKSEPVTVYRLLRERADARAARGLGGYGVATPLVGREAELETLQHALERMQGGRTQVVSVIGEAGAGKSRLVSEFLLRQEQQGRLADTVVRRVTCYATGEQTYGVVAALLRAAYDVAPDEEVETARAKLTSGFVSLGAAEAETAQLAGVLAHVLGLSIDDGFVEHLEPDQLKRQLYLAAHAVLERRLEHTALVLIVEDLHWADAASLELLGHLLERIGDRRLLLLATFRATHFQGLRAVDAERTLIRLTPLRRQQCEELLAACFATVGAPLSAALRDVIIERSGGNPLFLEEILRTLLGRGGSLAQRDGVAELRLDAESSGVPLTLHGLLLAHIDQLPVRARTVLQQAAVIGPVFDDALLSALNDRATVDDALAVLVAADLVVRAEVKDDGAARGRRTFRFRHGLLQEAVYQNLLVRRRTELHTRVGETLESLYGEEPKRLEEIEALAHHWSLSEQRQRGARYLIAAGDWARSLYANEDALRHYRRALDTLTQSEAGEAALAAVHERLGDVLATTGRGAEAAEQHGAAIVCYERNGNRAAQARQLRKVAELLWAAGDRATAKSYLQSALALLDDGDDPIERAHLYQTMGRLAFRSGDAAGAVDWARRALSAGESALAGGTEADARLAAAEAVAHAHNTLGVALAQLGSMREAVDQLECCVSIAFDNELLRAACRGMANLGVLYSTLDPRRAIETCKRGLETATRIGDFALQSRLYSNLAVAYCSLTNRCDEHGVGAARTAIELDRRLGQLDHLTVPLIVLAQIEQCHGSPRAALDHYAEALTFAEQTGEPQLLYPCYDGLASLYLDAGDETRAEQFMMQAQLVCERAGVHPETLVVLPFLD